MVSTFDPTSAISIKKLKNVLNEDYVINYYIYKSVDFELLESTVKQLETKIMIFGQILELIEKAVK